MGPGVNDHQVLQNLASDIDIFLLLEGKMRRYGNTYDDLDDALNRLYLRYQTALQASEEGRVAVTSRTRLPTGDLDVLLRGEHGKSLSGFLDLLPADATLSIMPGQNYDVFTLSW